MKTKLDPRHVRRRQTVKELFADSFTEQRKASELTRAILKKSDELDSLIQESATEWPVDKLSKIDLAVLRLAVYELLYETKTPPKVAIDEAVELAKEYGTESSPAFVNGVLGSVFEKINVKK